MTNQTVFGDKRNRGKAAAAALIIICLILSGLGDDARALLRYDRAGLAEGELWRVFSGHLVHLGWIHAVLNLGAFALLSSLFAGELRWADWLLTGVIAALTISLGLWFFAPETSWYVGLSGVLHAWFLLGALQTLRHSPRLGAVMLVGLTVKLLIEQGFGALPTTVALDVGPVVVDAHLFGALGGLVSAAALWLVRRFNAQL